MVVEGKPLVGRTLGDFVVRDQIGSGGFGVVYRAEQLTLGREAVIKVSTMVDEPDFVARFLREARLASQLDHPYAAHIYAFGSESDGTLWTAMELVRGTPLDQLIAHHGPLALDRFVPFFERLCEVVHTAHEQGIIHRDLKPANVMAISRAGRLLPKLLDLGIAKGSDRVTDAAARGGSGLGSPAFMAPEQWVDARKTDARTDIYALGVLAYQALTGRLPFSASSPIAFARLHARQPVPPLGAGFSSALDGVVAKAMAKRPSDRFATPLDMARALREAAKLEDEPDQLPELDILLREQLLAEAPQPLAEAIAAFDGARNAHQAQGALVGVVRVVVRLLGNLALAAWCRAPRDVRGIHPEIVTAVRELHRSGLQDVGWLRLARAIAEQFRDHRELMPIPELIDSCNAPALDHVLERRAWFEQHLAASNAAVRDQLAEALPILEQVLRGLSWLSLYDLVGIHDQRAERWMGVRRPHRIAVGMRGSGTHVEGEVLLLGADHAVAIPLAPLFHIAAPAPGHPRELFVLDGAGRDGARMVSLPTGFECSDASVWSWLATHVELADARAAGAATSKAPYRGLSAFTVDDADRFVGREAETEAFTNRLRVTPLLVVVGASGAGKSSFVQAGVVANLGATWTTVIARPGTTPIKTLRAAVTSALADVALPTVEGDGLGDGLRRWAHDHQRSVLLYIDQFEELFTLCHDDDERQRFADALTRAARDVASGVRVVLTVRDDFLLRCQQLAELRPVLAHGLQLLATPTATDLERILIEPARRAGYEFDDPALPREMVRAVASLPAALPLLSFTAAQMWDLRDRDAQRLSRKAYDTLGGVGGALAQHAERVFAHMSSEEQRVARVAFRNLVTADGTRAVLTRSELLELLGSRDAGESVLEKLINARLVTASEGAAGGDRVEVVHEALLAAWPRLIEWRREDAEGARLRDQLRAAARQWDDRGRPRGLVWRDEALTEYRLWRKRYPASLMAVEEAFADASVREAARGRRIRTAATAAIVGILVVGMTVALVLYRDASNQRGIAESERGRAVANEQRATDLVVASYLTQGQLAAASGDSNAALSFLAAAREGGVRGPTVEIPLATARIGITSERATYRGHSAKVQGLAITPDGQGFATAGADQLVAIWRVDHQQPAFVVRDSTRGVERVEISHDGRWLIAPSLDGHVRLYEMATGKLVHDWSLDSSQVFNGEFSADDSHVVAFSEEQTIGVWDRATGRELHKFKIEGKLAGYGDLSPDGKLLAIPNYDGMTRVVDLDRASVLRTLGPHSDTVWSVEFAPDGTLVASGSWDRTIKLWEPRTGKLIATLIGHAASVTFLKWSHNSKLVATGGRDGTVRIWNRSGQLVHTLQCDRGLLRDLDFQPDDERLLAACGDTTYLFDLRSGLPMFRHQAPADVYKVRFRGDHLVSGSADGTVRALLPQPTGRYAVDAHDKMVTHIDRCANDSTLSVGEDQIAKLWDGRGELRWRTPTTLAVADATCARTSDDRYIASVDGKLWRVGGDQVPIAFDIPLGLPANVLIALSPDAKKLAVVDDNRAFVVDLATRTVARGAAAPFKRTYEPKVTWASDGSVFAVASDAGVAVWDTSAKFRFAIPAPGGLLRRIALDSDHQLLFTTAFDPGVRSFSLVDGSERHRYPSTAFGWGVTAIGANLYVGYDDALLVEYDIASGRRTRVLGSFGSDVYGVSDAGDGLLWVGSGKNRVSLLDRASRAELFRGEIFSEPATTLAGRDLGVVTSGWNGTLVFHRVPQAQVSDSRLALEVRCHTNYALKDGTLQPTATDPEACARLVSH